ncbi:MAG: MFS transporter [Xanthomonadaceae bacterium]|nr:MFS transporter [Xanthomonadaceae bacterium]
MVSEKSNRSEKEIVYLITAIQFIHVLDFMMVMPLGPDFAKALGMEKSLLGFVGGSYTAAAALSGFIGSQYLDRFDRKTALLYALLGMAIGTFLGGFANSFATLIMARIIAGFFGGPSQSLAYSIISDIIPAERRGKAMGIIMGGFSIASVLGVPAGLELARLGSWRMPFFAVGALALMVLYLIYKRLPSMILHLNGEQSKGTAIFQNSKIWLSFAMISAVFMGNFVLIPNLSAYLQFNAGYPREKLGMLYLMGGIVSFFILRIAGRAVDQFGSTLITFFATVLLQFILFFGYFYETPHIPVIVMFVGFMFAQSIRNVSTNTLSSKIPKPAERARFQSLQSAVTHLACAIGAFLGAWLLKEGPHGELIGIQKLTVFSMTLCLIVPAFSYFLEKKIVK